MVFHAVSEIVFSLPWFTRYPTVVSVTHSVVPFVVAPGLTVAGVHCRTVVVAVCCAVRCQQCELVEFIAYLTGLNSNPSGSSDPWVAARRSGVPGGVPGGRVVIVVVSFPVGSECELQESVAAVAGCACFERGCWFPRPAVGFVLGLRVCVGVSRRLREPACGVAFTGAGLWSAELVLPKAALCVLLVAALSVEMSCHCCRLDCPCCSLLGCCRSRCGASDHVSCRGACQFVFLIIFRVSRLRWWDFVCPQDQEVGFVSCALWALPDSGLVSAMGVWLAVPLVGVLASRRGFLFRVRESPVVCLLPLLSVGCSGWWCFHMEFGAMSHTVATFVVKVPPLVLS
ncbi:hypothetical protein Taro_034063 [Colocasia esculenta]|uniref:Uncharacterized protein n=1 Tax=Colocasia esculenta TaxID=4460 RepID=A0A843W1U5_COLES|nr:hypothetical protein [Colocasia esculenta]